MSKVVEIAQAKYEDSAKVLIEAVQRTYPIGAHLTAELGGHSISIEVTGHSASWWHRPGLIYGRNRVSGADRRFMPTDIRSVDS